MFGQPLKVFLSSTSHDLAAYREKVADVIVKLGQVPLSMRDFGASNLSPVDMSMERVREAQVFVGLMGFRYGFVNNGLTKSVSELEYDTAMQMQQIILMYAPDPLHPPQFPGIPSQTDPNQQAFIDRVQHESHTYGSYRDPADLPAIVVADLHRVLTGGVSGIMAYRKGIHELETGNYTSALQDLSWAVHFLPNDGDPPFLLALALLQGRLPKLIPQFEILRVEELLRVGANLTPSRALYALWCAIKLDHFVHNGFQHPHLEKAEEYALMALQYPRDPARFDLIAWLQPELAVKYLHPFL